MNGNTVFCERNSDGTYSLYVDGLLIMNGLTIEECAREMEERGND